MVSFLVALAGGGYYYIYYYDHHESGAPPAESSVGSGAQETGTGEFKSAMATWYQSYPPCCKKSPNYDKNADKSECSDYNGCTWMGQFLGVDKTVPYEDVKARNIISFYDLANQKGSGESWWKSNVKGKKVELRNPATGKTLIAEALDSCFDSDCNGCCSKQAKKGGGYLIDLEINTAQRLYDGKVQDEAKIEWRWV